MKQQAANPANTVQELDFTTFVEAEYGRIYRLAYAFTGGHRELAQDAVQEAFSRAFARWGRLRKDERRSGWTIVTCMNICRRLMRRRPLDNEPAVSQGIEDQAVERLDVTLALRSLPSRQREAVVLHYILQHPVTVVAETMSLSEGAVKSHLSRARSTLKGLLESNVEAGLAAGTTSLEGTGEPRPAHSLGG